jgi:hypothetical protein
MVRAQVSEKTVTSRASMALLAQLVVVALAVAEPGLGTPLRQDGYSLRPPQGFRMERMELFRGTRATAVSAAASPEARGPGLSRWLSAALVDGDGDDAAAMVVSVVEGSFQATPAARDEFSTAVVRHFADELGMKLAMERAELVPGPAARIEVLGTLRQEDQVRRVLISAMAGDGRHVVVGFTAPTGRWEQLAAGARASLETFRNDAPAASDASRGLAAVVALVVAAALLVSLALWKRRRGARR